MKKARLFPLVPALAIQLAAGACAGVAECPKRGDAEAILFDGAIVSYSFSSYETNLQLGDTTTATAAVVAEAGCGYETSPKLTSREHPERFAWQSSDGAVVTVDSHGMLRAMGIGRAYITAVSAGVDAATFAVDVLPPITGIFISPKTAEVHVGDTLRFDAYLMDSEGKPIDVSHSYPYPVNLAPDGDQAKDVTNYLPGNRFQLVKRFDRPGTYQLNATTVVRNVMLKNAATITVLP